MLYNIDGELTGAWHAGDLAQAQIRAQRARRAR